MLEFPPTGLNTININKLKKQIVILIDFIILIFYLYIYIIKQNIYKCSNG